MFLLTLHDVYAICNLCIFGNIIRDMLRRFLFLHIVSFPRFNGHSSTYECSYHCFYMCILQRIWRGRLPGVCESGALTILVIPSRDCPHLVNFIMTLVLMCIDTYQYNLYRRVQGRKARHLALLACVLCITGERSTYKY